MQMRIAFVGKGGAGKSAIAGTFARLLAQRGEPVLVLDSDPLPGLAYSLGMDSTDAGIPDEAVMENPEEGGPRYILREGLTAADAVEQYAAEGPDGVRVLQFGKIHDAGRGLMRSQFAYRQITGQLPDDKWSIVGDLPGGTRQPFLGWGRYATTVLVVVEPMAKSLLSARRLARLQLIDDPPRVVALANKVRDEEDVELVAARTGLEVIGAVPLDDALAEADRRGRPVVEDARDSPAVKAIDSLVERLRAEEETA